ncbi:hypothetical protein CL622_04420 [archaeon]|nr:hypothetical protein [archaeon]|tara:strand:- start:140 stop:532 length:393 start_codon:yes stop_codon:yes gene_type:complete
MANLGGRPTTYNESYIAKALEYLETYKELGHTVPSVVGYCWFAGVAKSTVYDWCKKEENKGFSDTISAINEMQELDLINDSLTGKVNHQISKLLLAGHGYTDKVEQDIKSSDGSMTPRTMSDFYAEAKKD